MSLILKLLIKYMNNYNNLVVKLMEDSKLQKLIIYFYKYVIIRNLICIV